MKKGSSLPGKIALRLDKNILSKIKLPENIIMVTGSNGKTSTTEMIYTVLKENGYRVGCNKEGSNQIEGVTTMILNCCNITKNKKTQSLENIGNTDKNGYENIKTMHLTLLF